ncbi:unnamed protein product [Cylindrotheca closterium]|uniref:Protein kinase domain-containing protein n=1 Tax=Cylindrotheca closterium TaxID=2856 RepID=A0AAD2CTN9_9STRA|nr:unnamed protein product [Cylindrotheca closterium]
MTRNGKRLQRLCLLITLASCSTFAPAHRTLRRSLQPLRFQNEVDEQLLWDLPITTPFNPNNETPIGKLFKNTYVIDRQIECGSEKIQLYEAFHVRDDGKAYPMIVKLSKNIGSIQVEHEVYRTIESQLRDDERDCFVQIYDLIEEPNCIPGKSALVLEKGEEDLRTHIQRLGRFQGPELRSAMQKVIRIVEALHSKGMVWTEIKAENFIVQRDGTIKGIDLESVIYHQNYLQMYTAETVPPEFPLADLYQCVPSIQPDFSFDIWGLGIVMFEMATGNSFFDGGLKDIEFIKEKLYYIDEIEPFVQRKLWQVDPGARQIIEQCLRVDASVRSSSMELLQFPYFSEARRVTPTLPAIPQRNDAQVSNKAEQQSDHLQHQRMEGRQGGVLDIGLSQRVDAVVRAFQKYARKNPSSEGIFSHIFQWTADPSLPQLFSPQNHDISTQRFESVLMAINTVEKIDPQAAREFLYILHQTFL